MLNNINEKFLKTSDGIKIAINQFRTGHDEVIIIAHGWFMTKDSKYFIDMATVFSNFVDVISMDFRGHGKSSGFYTFTSKEPKDIKTVVEYAKKHYKKVYLLGFSLGGALVLIHSALEKNVDKVIAISAPFSFNKIENHMWRKEAWIQTMKKFELKRFFSIRPSLIVRKKIRPIDIVDKIEVPTLFIAGELDPTVHSWHTKKLFETAKCEKYFALFKNCYHAEDLFIQERQNFISLCKNWLCNQSYNENDGASIKNIIPINHKSFYQKASSKSNVLQELFGEPLPSRVFEGLLSN